MGDALPAFSRPDFPHGRKNVGGLGLGFDAWDIKGRPFGVLGYDLEDFTASSPNQDLFVTYCSFRFQPGFSGCRFSRFVVRDTPLSESIFLNWIFGSLSKQSTVT